jgi:hypothetical protein
MSTQVVEISQTAFRAVHAKRIRELMDNLANNAVELGRELKEVRDQSFPLEEVLMGKHKRRTRARVGWKTWLKAEIGISESHAGTLIRIFDKFGGVAHKLFPAGQRVLKYLASPHVPPGAEREIIGRAKKGEVIGPTEARKILARHRKPLPKPAEANRIARETGKPTLASDNYIYFGHTKAEAKVINDRRGVVFAVRRAITTLSAMQITPHQFLQYALPHQLLKIDDHGEVSKAADWLRAFNTAWQHRK